MIPKHELAERILSALSKMKVVKNKADKMVLRRKTYRDVAIEFYNPRNKKEINELNALLWKIANDPNYHPTRDTCRRLGIYEPILTEPCLNCGEVHTVPWCTKEAGIKPVKVNGKSKAREPSTIYIGKYTEEEKAAIRALTPAERKRRMLGG